MIRVPDTQGFPLHCCRVKGYPAHLQRLRDGRGERERRAVAQLVQRRYKAFQEFFEIL